MWKKKKRRGEGRRSEKEAISRGWADVHMKICSCIMGRCVTCPILYHVTHWCDSRIRRNAASRQAGRQGETFRGGVGGEGKRVGKHARLMVLSPSRRRGVTEVDSQWGVGAEWGSEWEMEGEEGGGGGGGVGTVAVAGGDGVCVCVRRWVGESAVGTGISTLSHRVSVQPSTTAEHTALDSSAHAGLKRAHTHAQV